MSQRRRRSRVLRGAPARLALAGMLAGAVLIGGAVPALAVPAPPNPSDGQIVNAQLARRAAAAEVGRIAAQVAATETELEKVGVQAEAAGQAYMEAEDQLAQAQQAAERTAAQLRAAAAAVQAAQHRIADFSRDSYMQGHALTSSAALLDSAGPGELIQRAAMLDYVASNQLDVLGQLQVARIQQANADSAARDARDRMAAAEKKARAAKEEADSKLAAQQAAFDRVAAQKAGLERQLQIAQIKLLRLQGARNAYQAWVEQKHAEEAAAQAAAERAARAAAQAAAGSSGGGGDGGGGGGGGGGNGTYVKPATGRVSSCYGWRWGALHGGVDIAAPIGTNIYSVQAGTVERAGPATGFGLAVYIRGDDGSVSVYGHVNEYYVYAGQRVAAGEHIADVGNRGQSTGPHLHFEVHPSGQMYSGRVDPVPWLNARGIYLGGCGG
jgi:murein DD-endopeptidase MepM/ murein hydrolase activator NlpD